MQSDDHGSSAVQIQFDPDQEQLAGRIRVDDGPEQTFSGWLELMRALEIARDGSSAENPVRTSGAE